MGAYRDENKNGTWYCKFSYVNWKGQKLIKKDRSTIPVFLSMLNLFDLLIHQF